MKELACMECGIDADACALCELHSIQDPIIAALYSSLRRLVHAACEKCGQPSQGYEEACKSCEVLELEKKAVEIIKHGKDQMIIPHCKRN